METYTVRRLRERDAVSYALRASSLAILEEPDGRTAPLVFRVRDRLGEELRLVCYVFFANKHRRTGRAEVEHRMQVKYGNDLRRYHALHVAERPDELVLFFALHEDGYFVAVDPAMHNPIRFSRAIELDADPLDRLRDTRWIGWERDRSRVRRRELTPLLSFRTEAVLAFMPERFGDYLRLERASTGLSPGERLYLIDKMTDPAYDHALVRQLAAAPVQLRDVHGEGLRLTVAVRRSVTEAHLHRLLEEHPDVVEVEPLDAEGLPDFRVVFQRHGERLVECSTVLRRAPDNRMRLDFQKVRASRGTPCSRYYAPTDFHLLAACLFPVTETWAFRFTATGHLGRHESCGDRLAHEVYVDGAHWHDDPVDALPRL